MPRNQRRDASEVYREHRGIIVQVAKRVAHGYNHVDFDELISVGNLAFVKAYNAMDWGRGTRFSTLLYTVCMRDMHRAMQKNDDGVAWSGDTDMDEFIDPSTEVPSWSPGGLSQAAKDVIDVIMRVPEEMMLCCPSASPKVKRGALSRYMQRNGWSRRNVTDAFAEIKAHLNNGRA